MTNKKLYTGLAKPLKAKLTNQFGRTTLATRLTLPPGAFYSQKLTLARLAGLSFQDGPQLHFRRETCKKGEKRAIILLELILSAIHVSL